MFNNYLKQKMQSMKKQNSN